MKLTSYKKVLRYGKEKIQEALAPVREIEMKRKAEMEMAKLESDIIQIEAQVNEACCGYPIDFSRLICLMDKRDLLERRKKQFSKIIAEMFD